MLKVGNFNYCFIRVNDKMLVFVMVFVSRFGRCSARNVVAGYYVGIHFKQVEFELNIYIYLSIIYRVCEIVGWPPLMENPGYATDKLH